MNRSRRHAGVCAAAAASLLAGCTVPRDMHITYGNAPNHIDDDVRFRTTYYFRTFDYCWDADKVALNLRRAAVRPANNRVEEALAKLGQFDENQRKSITDAFGEPNLPSGIGYRDIIPETDTLYRYRMTGKASSVFNQIHFESGTLDKADIDPFGTDVSYSNEGNGFIVRSRDEVKDAAAAAVQRDRIAAERTAAFAEVQRILTLLPASVDKAPLVTTLAKATDAYVATLSTAPQSSDVQKKLADISEAVEFLKKDAIAKTDAAAVADTSTALTKAEDNAKEAIKREITKAYGDGYKAATASATVVTPPAVPAPPAPGAPDAPGGPDAPAAPGVPAAQPLPGALPVAAVAIPPVSGIEAAKAGQAGANSVAPVVAAAQTAKGNAAAAATPAVNQQAIADATAIILQKFAAVQAEANRVTDFEEQCRVGAQIRKGFQVMGPEGLRTFDQNKRLLLAMTSSAKPLIATLQEYSGRVLAAKASPAARQLPLARADARIQAARRAVSDAQLAKAPPGTLFDSAIAALAPAK